MLFFGFPFATGMTDDPLWGLLYESTPVEEMRPEHLQELLAQSRSRNEEMGITGWLTYAPGVGDEPPVFTQYIEGRQSVVRQLFYGSGDGTGILSDPRHASIRIIQEGAFGGGPPGCRLYPRWFMEWVDAPRPAGE